MDSGVLLEATKAYQLLESKPGYPDSAMVGTSGNEGTLFELVTAIARSFPLLIWGWAEEIVE